MSIEAYDWPRCQACGEPSGDDLVHEVCPEPAQHSRGWWAAFAAEVILEIIWNNSRHLTVSEARARYDPHDCH